jgi:hypothetical protein
MHVWEGSFLHADGDDEASIQAPLPRRHCHFHSFLFACRWECRGDTYYFLGLSFVARQSGIAHDSHSSWCCLFPPLWFMVTQMRVKGVFDVTQLHGSPEPQCSVVELEPTLNLEKKVLKVDWYRFE